MASLEELLAIQQEVDQPQGQTASIDELMAIQQELDQPDETPGLFEEFIAIAGTGYDRR